MRRVIAAVLAAAALASCSSDSEATGPSASVTVTTLSAIEREVEAAYLKSWDVYADAMLRLDTSRLSESYAEDQLKRTAADVQRQIDEERPVRVSVDHDYSVSLGAGNHAEITDRYRNHSVILDPVTRQPAEPDPNSLNVDVFTLKEIQGTWKVVHIQQDS